MTPHRSRLKTALGFASASSSLALLGLLALSDVAEARDARAATSPSKPALKARARSLRVAEYAQERAEGAPQKVARPVAETPKKKSPRRLDFGSFEGY